MVEHPPMQRFVLEGRVVTMGPAGVLDDGAIYIDAGTIEAVEPADAPLPDAKYEGAPRIRTGDTLFPGLIELHNHLSYNAMPLWDVPRRYSNNGQWRGTEEYTQQITKPSQVLGQTDGAAQALVRYAECRALLGGTTTSQGITLANAGGTTKFYRGLVRNAEDPDDPRLPSASTNVANPPSNDPDGYLDRLTTQSCYLQHLSEGSDDTARGWFQRLQIDESTWAVTEALCGIHCTALGEEDFQVLADRGASMVWSPLSNYLLYGATTDMAAAKAAGINTCLGCDWAPSGSKNLLGELKVAWLASQEMGDLFTPRELVEMVTLNPARAVGWEGITGAIVPGALADIVAINGQSDDPYRLLLDARETSVTFVLIGGVPRVGQGRIMRRFWDAALSDASWLDRITVGRSTRYLYVEHAEDLLDGLPLSQAVADLSDAMARLPELAAQVDAGLGTASALTASGAVAFGGGFPTADGERVRVLPDLEADDLAVATATIGFELAAQPYAFWVTEPLELDPLTVVDDTEHLRTLAAARNLPEFVKRGLPELYGVSVPVPDSASFLDTADARVDPRLRETTTDLHQLLRTFGELTLDDRRRIVDQAIVLLVDNYVHLPLKQAMHAADPVQRLRLLQRRLDDMTTATMPPELEFHAEVTEIFDSVHDLHTGYRLPFPFGSKVAWLPFLVEQVHDRGQSAYLLTKWVADAWPDERMAGATVTHWNGTPIETVIARNAARPTGSNPHHARGLNGLTVRPLSRARPPDEDWVTLRWVDADGGAHEHTQEWLVFEPGSAIGPGELVAEAASIGIDDHTDDVQDARKVLYAPQVAAAERAAAGQYVGAAITDAAGGLESHLPGVFRARTVQTTGAGPGDPSYGYIRIFTFHVPKAEPFVDEFVRLAGQLPEDGLVIDVRGNGGGLISAAEELLQVLTPARIEPEPAQFINRPLNLRICRNHAHSTRVPGLELAPWVDSMAQAVQTASVYSLGFPMTSPDEANQRGQAYHGPVVLITDGLCYSATDIFAAGFQDHDIGPVIGVGGGTGAGGANVWSHRLLRTLMEPDNTDPGPSPYQPLPHGADLRVAIRRTLRVGARAGTVLEDLGVTPDQHYLMTRRDVLEGNRDLIDAAIRHLAERRPHAIRVGRVQRHRDRAPSVTLHTTNIDRIDAQADGRQLRTRDVRRNRVTLKLEEAVPGRAGAPIQLEVAGHDGDELVATLRETIPRD